MNEETTKYPSFDEAEARFREFLKSSGWPEDVVWVSPDDVAVVGQRFIVHPTMNGREYAINQYREGTEQNLGILLNAICSYNACSYCVVWIPSDAIEAEYALMQPGLKLSVPSEFRQGQVVAGRIRWWWMKRTAAPWRM